MVKIINRTKLRQPCHVERISISPATLFLEPGERRTLSKVAKQLPNEDPEVQSSITNENAISVSISELYQFKYFEPSLPINEEFFFFFSSSWEISPVFSSKSQGPPFMEETFPTLFNKLRENLKDSDLNGNNAILVSTGAYCPCHKMHLQVLFLSSFCFSHFSSVELFSLLIFYFL